MPETYKGMTVPLYADVADGPLSFRSLVNSGPIPRFASTATRNAAIPSPVRGQVVWRNDLPGFGNTNGGLEVFGGGSGAAGWRSLIPAAPPAHKHSGVDVNVVNSLHGNRILNDTIVVSGANDKLVGIIAAGHLPAATATVAGALQTDHPHTQYVPLAGGTVVKTLAGTYAAPGLRIGNGTEGIFSDTANALEFRAGDTHFRFSGNGLAFLPGQDNQLGLGGAEYRWKYLYAVDGSINTSDPSWKHIDGRLTKALDLIRAVDPISFRWRKRDTKTRHFGFDASEVQKVMPDVVVGKPGSLGIRERDLLAVLWAAVRELDARTA